MTTTGERPATTPYQGYREVVGRVMITVTHPGPVKQNTVIQQGTVAVLGVVHALDETGEQRHLMRVDLGVLFDVVRIQLMV